MAKEIGLLIGAGASCELGMPLVWDLTRELKKWLTTDKLRELNRNWRRQGGGYADHVIEDVAGILGRPDLHYENILGYLETQFRRHNRRDDPYHGIYVRLVEIISIILIERHIKNRDYIVRNLRYFEGIQELAEQSKPLRIFSLNHDLLIECLSAHYKIPLSSGFSNTTVSLPRRNATGIKIGELNAETLEGIHLTDRAMPFFSPGSYGINLLKVHGALDVFTFRDGKDLLKLLPASTQPSVDGYLESLRAVNEELICVEFIDRHLKTTNEITYSDDSNQMQFLRRTILSGAFKFDQRMSQVLPLKLLDHFKSNLNYVSQLICFGYSFGDTHINDIVRNWLEFSSERTMEVVDPKIVSVPGTFAHLAPQVTIHPTTMSNFLDERAGIKREKVDLLTKKVGAWIRSQPSRNEGEIKFGQFMESYLRNQMEKIVTKLSAVPLKDGDIDLKVLDLTKSEFISNLLRENRTPIEDLLEAFLKDK